MRPYVAESGGRSRLVRLYTAYMLEEYGGCESDYVFVNLLARPCGAPLRYQAVHELACRLRERSGVDFTLSAPALRLASTADAVDSLYAADAWRASSARRRAAAGTG